MKKSFRSTSFRRCFGSLYTKVYTCMVLLFITIPQINGFAEQPTKKVKLSGKIIDQVSQTPLIGATVFIPSLGKGVPTDVDGNFSIDVPAGTYDVTFAFIGYNSLSKEFKILEDLFFKASLTSTVKDLDEVVVTSERKGENIAKPEMGVQKLQSKTIKSVPVLLGETDVIKVIQLMPGVQAASEGSTGFSVRGGNPDQNLVLLDDATIYNAGHFMGFFSVFNNDAVNDVKLYKGDMPVAYGGRLSSLLDVEMREGDKQQYHAIGGIGLISSRLTIEGPLWKNKTSLLLSGRRTYFDVFMPLAGNEMVRKSKIYFYDLNGKLSHTFNDNNHLFLSGYLGRDLFRQPMAQMEFGNKSLSARWSHIFNEDMYMNITIHTVNSDYNNHMSSDDATTAVWKSVIKDYGFKAECNKKFGENNTVNFGFQNTYHKFEPGTARGEGEKSLMGEIVLPYNYALENALFISNIQKIGERISLRYGVRFSTFHNMGKTTLYTYDDQYDVADSTDYGSGHIYNNNYGIEPRVSGAYIINEATSVKASYSRTYQYMQQASVSTAGTPLDVWYMTSPNVKPQISDQISVGVFRNVHDNDIELSLEAFYKNMQHTIDFKDHPNVMLNKFMEGELRFGSSRAYGIEAMARINLGPWNGWISYTLSRADRKINGINDNKRYLSPYHHSHDCSVVMSYKLNKRCSLSGNWVFIAGAPTTYPVARYEVGGDIVPLFSSRNQDRLPHYHRLDLSFTIANKPKPDRKWDGEWVFSLYNAYNHHNTWAINFERQDSNNGGNAYEIKSKNVYLFPVIPSITYNFKF